MCHSERATEWEELAEKLRDREDDPVLDIEEPADPDEAEAPRVADD